MWECKWAVRGPRTESWFIYPPPIWFGDLKSGSEVVGWFWLVGSRRAGMDWGGLVTPTPSRHVCHPDGEMEMKKRAQIGLAAAEAGWLGATFGMLMSLLAYISHTDCMTYWIPKWQYGSYEVGQVKVLQLQNWYDICKCT